MSIQTSKYMWMKSSVDGNAQKTKFNTSGGAPYPTIVAISVFFYIYGIFCFGQVVSFCNTINNTQEIKIREEERTKR